jgi:GLPGLI family protein
MNTKIIVIIFATILLGHVCLSAQIKKGEQYMCIYTALFNIDFDRGKDIREFDGKLILTHDKSFFFLAALKNTYLKDDDDFNITIKSDTLFKVIKDRTNNVSYFPDNIFSKKEIYYRDSLHQMSWQLTTNRKKIDSLDCYLATCFFRGRHYSAWYAPGIPIPDGPWKSGGLPGLIIEFYDENKDMYFLLREFTSLDQGRINDKIPLITSNLSFNDYVGAGQKFMTRFWGAMKAQEANCLTCQSNSKVKFFFWENVFKQ